LLRVLRILRLLRLLSWIADLNIMLRSISTSAKAMMYVILLMFLFFYNFAIIGVLLFQDNDYYHFGDIFKAVLTLFQVISNVKTTTNRYV
jgi:voltage-gated sodium channel